MTTEVQRIPQAPLAPVDASPPVFALFQQALEKGAEGAGAMETLYKLYTAEREHAARIAFNRALAKFQSECPPIPRDGTLDYLSKQGTQRPVHYASLESIVETARPHLLRNGFSFTFDSVAGEVMHTERCTLQHEDGHSVSSSFALPTANKNPGMSEQQKYAGASTFAQRRCLIAVLGLVLTDPDPDGASDPTTITDQQAADLRALVNEKGAKMAKVLAYAGTDSVEAILASDYARVIVALKGWKAS